MDVDGPSGAKRTRYDLTQLSTENATADEIIAALDADATANSSDVLDEAGVKRLSNQLEKKATKNRELRIKYADDPQKFLESEMELNTAIQDMYALTAQVELYPLLVKFGTVQLVLQLLSHENADIVAVICNLLQELTDLDAMYENEDAAKDLIDELMQSRIIENVVQALKKLNEEDKDEADAVHNLLSVVENLFEFRPEAVKTSVEEGLFNWLLLRATRKGPFDANRQFASQHLAVILQTSTEAQEKLTEKVDGIDLLLRALAVYKKTDPGTRDESEHMENLFDSLCAALALKANRQIFLENEGVQLLNLILKEKKKQSRSGALKALSFATAPVDGGANCDKFIEIYGLRTLIPMFMRTPQQTKKKDTAPDEHDEHVISVIDALLFQCNDENRERVLQQFAKHGFELVDRAVELFLKYKERVDNFTTRLRRKLRDNDEDMDAEEVYAEQLNNGLFTLQRITLILTEVVTKGDSECKLRAAKLIKMKTRSTLTEKFEPILRDLHGFLDEEAVEQRTRIEKLIENLNTPTEANPSVDNQS
ncbi:DUF1716 domain-containing protein [Aphelenchoides besseyi]|nr:DUF1716 domain-containing protein [Aphelenchoides besseyi]